ncbi:enoyl-CoA hydratase-related protein [Saccharicrinis aurantiacus]|uniref:enoyl-CoA hydratase-related protein n=1 Tax=Saccharicrinis aurantiacus TaxID=1849719 RepID=UPI0008398BD2|nr:enoyl-CoA hydratase-related protein [Saccharicrinis aurantiacus]
MQTITFSIENKIAYLGLNRPEKRNALNRVLIEEIIETLETSKANRDIRVLVLYGEGETFCAGADLEWMKQGVVQDKTRNINDAKLFTTLFNLIHKFPKPVLCEVQKSAFGGAVGIMACSDIVIADKDAVFGFPEIKLGLIPATIAPYILTKMGSSNTRKRLLIPDPFTAEEALNEGLVHFITEKNSLRETTIRIAQSIAQAAPAAIIQTKDLIHRLEENVEEETAHLFCARLIAGARTSSEGQEGVKAFLEKRKPYWIESNSN